VNKVTLSSRLGLFTACLLVTFSLIAPGKIRAKEEVTIGRIENVILLPWGVKLPARIDTGATVSSLDARELRIEGDWVEFKLREKYGSLKLRLPIVDWHHVKSPSAKQRRPVVEVNLCIGSRKIRTRVNLTDRSMVKYPLILGRSILKEGFVVDVRKSKIVRPVCPEETQLPASK
jgi:hypothetical protein